MEIFIFISVFVMIGILISGISIVLGFTIDTDWGVRFAIAWFSVVMYATMITTSYLRLQGML